jgi:hypothetical protein
MSGPVPARWGVVHRLRLLGNGAQQRSVWRGAWPSLNGTRCLVPTLPQMHAARHSRQSCPLPQRRGHTCTMAWTREQKCLDELGGPKSADASRQRRQLVAFFHRQLLLRDRVQSLRLPRKATQRCWAMYGRRGGRRRLKQLWQRVGQRWAKAALTASRTTLGHPAVKRAPRQSSSERSSSRPSATSATARSSRCSSNAASFFD